MDDFLLSPEFEGRLRQFLSDVFAAGVKTGAERMRIAIIQAAQVAPDGPEQTHQVTADLHSSSSMHAKADRAPRGAVRAAIQRVLADSPGITEQDLGLKVNQYDPEVSAKSMGGELRRKRGELYRSEGGRWFLITENGNEKAADSLKEPADLLAA